MAEKIEMIKCQMNCGESVDRKLAKNVYFMPDGSNWRDHSQNPPIFKNCKAIKVCSACFDKVANTSVKLTKPDITIDHRTEDGIKGKGVE